MFPRNQLCNGSIMFQKGAAPALVKFLIRHDLWAADGPFLNQMLLEPALRLGRISLPFTERGFFLVKFLDDFGILPNSGGNSTTLGTVTA